MRLCVAPRPPYITQRTRKSVDHAVNIAPPSLNLARFINADIQMPTDSTTPSPADHLSSSAPIFKQLSGAPLIPERILRKHGPYCSFLRFRCRSNRTLPLMRRSHPERPCSFAATASPIWSAGRPSATPSESPRTLSMLHGGWPRRHSPTARETTSPCWSHAALMHPIYDERNHRMRSGLLLQGLPRCGCLRRNELLRQPSCGNEDTYLLRRTLEHSNRSSRHFTARNWTREEFTDFFGNRYAFLGVNPERDKDDGESHGRYLLKDWQLGIFLRGTIRLAILRIARSFQHCAREPHPQTGKES